MKIAKGLITIIFLFAVIGAIGIYTKAIDVLVTIDLSYFLLAALAFVLSISIWIFSWGIIIRRHVKVPHDELQKIGFSALYGALTPIQLGAEALRAMHLKKDFGLGYTDAISSAMLAKGTKFLIIGIFGIIALAMFYLNQVTFDPLLLLGLASGFFVIGLASFLFIAPLSRRLTRGIVKVFGKLSKYIKFLENLCELFVKHSKFLRGISVKDYSVIFALNVLSFALEFSTIVFIFWAFGVSIDFLTALILVILIALLERTPILPRGIGLVEVVGIAILSVPFLVPIPTSLAVLGAIFIVFDVVRLLIPTGLSIFTNVICYKTIFIEVPDIDWKG